MIGIAVAVPVIPFLIAGHWIESSIASGLAAISGRPLATSAAVVSVLAVDILLPVPSSGVAALAGQTLGPATAVLCVWLGMMISSAVGFEAARRWGKPLAERFCRPMDLAASEERFTRWGSAALLLTRPLPILAEACVLWAGLQGFPRRPFYSVIAVANAAVAGFFVILGWVSSEGGLPALGLLLSVLLPLLMVPFVGRK